MRYHDIRFVTANFHQLQGLRLVPFGILFIGTPLGLMPWLPPAVDRFFEVMFGGWYSLTAALACAFLVTAYYRRRYGTVAQHHRRLRNSLLATAVVAYWVLSAHVDTRLDWPVSLSSLFVSACLFLTVRVDGFIRVHYLFGAVIWFILAFILVFPIDPYVYVFVFYLTGGLTLIVCGIGDHLLITRTLAGTKDHASKPTVV